MLGALLATAVPDTVINGVTIPYTLIIAIVLGAVVAGLVAAWCPARKASKMDVLEAIATDVTRPSTRRCGSSVTGGAGRGRRLDRSTGLAVRAPVGGASMLAGPTSPDRRAAAEAALPVRPYTARPPGTLDVVIRPA